MTFGKVIDIILKYHAEALLDPVIKKPYAWSLFQAWKWVISTKNQERRQQMKKKIKFYKALLAEICETLCTICFDGAHNPGSHGRMRTNYMSHFYQLKSFSEKLRGKEAADEREQTENL